MSVGAFAFITITLFMIHEFDEIIFIRRYIDKHAKDERYASEMFIAGVRIRAFYTLKTLKPPQLFLLLHGISG